MLKGDWRENRQLLGNASSLVATTAVTSALGFAYWTLAARLFSQRLVGYGSAAVSSMTLLGTIGMFGLGTVLIGELPQKKTGGGGLISAALIASAIGSLILGSAFAVAAPYVSPRFANVTGSPVQAVLFGAGVALTAVTLLFDQATIGLMRGGSQLLRNATFAVVKLPALLAVAIILHRELGSGIMFTWVAGMALSLVAAALWLRFKGASVLPRPEWDVLRGLGRTALAHSWLNVAIMLPFAVVPVLVTVVVSPAANASFYAAWTLVSFLKIVPTHLSTVLFAVAAAEPKIIARKLRFTLRLSMLIGLPGMAVLGFGSHLALSMFGASYARAATVPLCLLVAGYLPNIPKAQYIAVCRASGHIPRAAAIMTVAAAMDVIATIIGGVADGLVGIAAALLIASLAEALITSPAVWKAAIGRGRHRRPDSLGDSSNVPSGSQYLGQIPSRRTISRSDGPESEISEPKNRRQLQEAGLAALQALACSTGTTGPIPIVMEGYPRLDNAADKRSPPWRSRQIGASSVNNLVPRE